MMSSILAITPGADWAYANPAGPRHRSVIPAVSGLLVGHLAATVVVAVGLPALLARSPLIMTILTTTSVVWLYITTLDPRRPRGPSATWLGPGCWMLSRARASAD